MKTFTEAEQVLAAALPGYESRPQQQRLAQTIEQVFGWAPNFAMIHPDAETQPLRRHLIAQAGCGCGKSLGYLIPSILSGKRVVVSVTTKALQDQLANKDLPFLEEHLGVNFSWTVLKGRGNYFCANKAADADESEFPMLAAALKESAEAGFSGLREDFSFEMTDMQWSRVNAEAEECNANNCRDDKSLCFAEAARARAKECQIVVVNHALFFTDLMVKVQTEAGGMLEEYDLVVFDEAHEAAEIAGNTLGGQFSEGTIRSLANEIRSWAIKYSDGGEDAFSGALTTLQGTNMALFAALPSKDSDTMRLRERELDSIATELGAVFEALTEVLGLLNTAKTEQTADYRKAKQRRDRLRRRTMGTIDRLTSIISADFASLVRWVEVENKRTRAGWEKRKVIKVAPVDVAPFLRENLFTKTPTVLVSATLAVKGSMAFAASRLGIDEYGSLDVGTPFNFAQQARLYVPIHLPEPIGQNVRAWEAQATEEIVRLIQASHGRALVLFTSVKQMRAAFEAVSRRTNFPIKMQGQESVKDLSSWFAAETHGVLFGSKSFMTGFDIQGESLVNVIVVKMPFPVPTEPLTEARCEAIEAAGGSAFGDYTIPVMSLVLQQAVGRGIRHTNDRCVISILDPRMMTKGYGKQIVRDLPPMPVIKTMAEAQGFFAEIDAHFGTELPEAGTPMMAL